MNFVCPAGDLQIRSDAWGAGIFGAYRGELPSGELKYHDGLDLIVTPGQNIYSMIDGTFEKVEYPYRALPQWTGIQIANPKLRVEIWYMEPRIFNPGAFIHAGDTVGTAQDISQKYGKDPELGWMTPHIHVRVTLRAMTLIANNRYIPYDVFIDPLILLIGV